MNILYISNVMEFGGVEKCIIQLSNGFKKDNKVIVCTAGGPLTKELAEINIPHYTILNTDSKGPRTIIKNLNIIYKIIKDENIDIVHSHHRMTTLYCKFLSRFMKFKLIHTQHLCIEDKVKFTKFALGNIPIITVSDGAKKNLITKYGLDGKNITTIYNTVETKNSNYTIDDKLIELKNNGNFIVSQISRLVDYKGVLDFVEIANKVCKIEKNIKFVLIGSGPERDNIIKLIRKYNLDDNVFLLGNKDNIINQLKYIDLVLLCSYIEGLPLVPLEAFSQGIPVIGTNIGGTNEEIIDNVNGFLVEKRDVDTFAKKIIELYRNKEVYIKQKENSIAIFNSKFNKKMYIDNHKKYYNNIQNYEV
ncbi:MAG: glycosyltransferase family 4 protein [Romboutsia timonensis]|uniref:glycosyltransferase family 4 protein n=1 Tax=Romboutsia timonensis TaxID=1776391 RepID=UPI002A7646C3|nr:glycosyltransferase family 4 protein [Romboutsia timonensis]MDY2882250.1 glycosyltransferase family 4 protein [Romboutsia timonensis]